MTRLSRAHTILGPLTLTTALGFGLASCATAEQDTLRGAQITITTYVDVYQPALLTYGHLPACAPNVTPLCHDAALYAQLKAADKAATSAIVAAQTVLEGKTGTGTEIADAMQAIADAETAIASHGVLK